MEREDWNRRWQERGLHFHDDPGPVLVAELGPLPPARALDLGCGGGRNAVWLAERGWQVIGVDFSDAALGLARALAAERNVDVAWVEADVREYEPAAGSFELVLVLYLHLPADERRRVLGRAARALAPGARLLVLGHDVENLGTGAPGPTNPDVLYTAEALTEELRGLVIDRAEQVTRDVETEDGRATAIDTLVVASLAA